MKLAQYMLEISDIRMCAYIDELQELSKNNNDEKKNERAKVE